jgi:20S proteasome alpha/beta subunit
MSGLTADSRTMIEHARVEAQVRNLIWLEICVKSSLSKRIIGLLMMKRLKLKV